jgi:hypothetical protein
VYRRIDRVYKKKKEKYRTDRDISLYIKIDRSSECDDTRYNLDNPTKREKSSPESSYDHLLLRGYLIEIACKIFLIFFTSIELDERDIRESISDPSECFIPLYICILLILMSSLSECIAEIERYREEYESYQREWYTHRTSYDNE